MSSLHADDVCERAQMAMKVSKGAKIRNRYNQVPHLKLSAALYINRNEAHGQ